MVIIVSLGVILLLRRLQLPPEQTFGAGVNFIFGNLIMLKIFPVKTDEDLRHLRAIRTIYIDFLESRFIEYLDESWYASAVAKHRQEVLDLPGPCCAPSGCLLLATTKDQVVGCIALEGLDNGKSEMGGLFIKPESRKSGIGRQLIEAVIKQARGICYTYMRLVAYQEMPDAIGLYLSIGFNEIKPFADDLTGSAFFMGLKLK